MTSFLYAASVEQFKDMLGALSGMLDKAERYAASKSFEIDVLLNARLRPDMFHLTRQIQLVCGFAVLSLHKLSGREFTPAPRTETTLPEVRALIAKTLELVQSFDDAALDGGERRMVTFPTGPESSETWTGRDFLLRFVMPNFYFHLSQAYAILRHNGVPLRKRDYTTFLPR